jgi:coproporphyrinogen III oxidase
MKNQFYPFIQQLQNTLTAAFEALEGKARFEEDVWQRPEGGGGHTRVIEQGDVIEIFQLFMEPYPKACKPNLK